MPKLILAIDFDETICDNAEAEPGYKMGQPFPGAKRVINSLYEEGHKIIVHCVWADKPAGVRAIEKWLKYFGISYHSVTAQKPAAHVYLDDRGLTYENWAKAEQDIKRIILNTDEDDGIWQEEATKQEGDDKASGRYSAEVVPAEEQRSVPRVPRIW